MGRTLYVCIASLLWPIDHTDMILSCIVSFTNPLPAASGLVKLTISCKALQWGKINSAIKVKSGRQAFDTIPPTRSLPVIVASWTKTFDIELWWGLTSQSRNKSEQTSLWLHSLKPQNHTDSTIKIQFKCLNIIAITTWRGHLGTSVLPATAFPAISIDFWPFATQIFTGCPGIP